MLLLLAFSASAQPFTGGLYGPYYNGAGTPGPYYAAPRPVAAAQTSPYAPRGFYGPAPVNVGARLYGGVGGGNGGLPSQDQFDMYLANQQVLSDTRNQQGNNLFFNQKWSDLFPTGVPVGGIADNLVFFSSTAKAAANQISENALQDQIDYFRATHPQPLSQADRNTLNDLILQRDSAREQKLRRAVSAIPGTTFSATNGPYSAFFERQSNADNRVLAQNSLTDARQAYQQDPSQENLIKIRNAQDNIEQAEDRQDANTYDLLGTTDIGGFKDIGRLGPILRKRSSTYQISVAERNLRVARQAYAKDPSEDNRLDLRLARLYLEAQQQDDLGNAADVVVGTLTPGGAAISKVTSVASLILENKAFQDESDAFLKYSRLKRRILQRKQAKLTQSVASSTDPNNVVAQRLLGLSTYGSSPSTPNPRIQPGPSTAGQ